MHKFFYAWELVHFKKVDYLVTMRLLSQSTLQGEKMSTQHNLPFLLLGLGALATVLMFGGLVFVLVGLLKPLFNGDPDPDRRGWEIILGWGLVAIATIGGAGVCILTLLTPLVGGR